jgi:hypothetical protein
MRGERDKRLIFQRFSSFRRVSDAVESETLEALRPLVGRRAIAYFNTERYHTSVGYQTPAWFSRQFLDSFTLRAPKWFPQ